MPITFQSPTPHPTNFWTRPETLAVLLGIAIEGGGLAAGLLTGSVVLSAVALGGAALLGAAFAISKR